MLDFETYTTEQKAKIIVDCILKIPEKKEYLEDSVDYTKYQISMQPELQSEKKEVLEKYGKVFSLKNIDKLTAKKYKSFLVYKNNHHWDCIQRDGGRVVKNIKELRNTLKILVDETIPVEERLKKMRTSKMTLGKSTFTPILLVASNMKHAVVNDVITGTDAAFEQLGLTTNEQTKKLEEWEFYALAQKITEYIAQIYDFDLWEMDWVWWDLNFKRNLGESPKYWLLMPGTGSSQKDKWISEGYCAIGYADLFLPRYFSRDGKPDGNRKVALKAEIKKQLETKEKQDALKKKRKPKKIHPNAVSKKWKPLGQFIEIARNDVLILWNGTDKIFAKAIVGEGHYYYKKDKDLHKHRRNVTWKADERDIPDDIINSPPQGIIPLYGEEGRANHEFFKWLMGDSITTMSTTPNNYQEDLALLKWEKNLILYGPPGTGKTYHAGKIAYEFLKDNIQPTWLTCAARILTEHGGTPMPYKDITDLILQAKLKVTSAAETPETPEETVGRDIREDIEKGTDSFFKKEERGSYGLKTPMTFIKGIKLILTCFGEQHYEKITKTLLDNDIVQSDGATPEKTLLAVMTDDINKNGENSLFVATSTPGVYDLRKKSLRTADSYKNNITFHQSYSYEEFIEGIKAKVEKDESDPKSIKRYVNYVTEPGIFKTFCSRAESDSENNYVMIIDEINRGNISKIFGELITVIEKDKRKKPVTLPYSNTSFSVPENVYVIGTMNTADRSIAKIDTALTRRFGRREIMPDSGVLDNKTVKGINLTELLDKLNDKIKVNHRDRQIGHSYLMDGNSAIDNISDLRLAFLYDIIPLLKELTFDHDEELKEIIGSHFINYKTKNIKENMTDDEFEKEMQSFLNSDPKENESEDKDGDETDAEKA
jgi:hypothetical protein